MDNLLEIEVVKEDEGKRLDVFLDNKLKEKSRSAIQRLINEGFVKLDGNKPKASNKIKAGQTVVIVFPELKKLDVEAEDIPIDILYEDSDIAVINKPKGMVVHPACGNYTGTLVNALLFNCKELSGINGTIEPGIVHRIDKDTSGILVVAKNDKAHLFLSNQLKVHSVKRIYFALVYGNIKENSSRIDAPIGRHKTERKKNAVLKCGGRDAVTNFEVLERFGDYTFIKAILETGRTHQIRVHMAYIGHPLVGDELYGPRKQKIKTNGQMLHAATLGFIHPSTEKYMEFESPLPKEFLEVLLRIKMR